MAARPGAMAVVLSKAPMECLAKLVRAAMPHHPDLAQRAARTRAAGSNWPDQDWVPPQHLQRAIPPQGHPVYVVAALLAARLGSCARAGRPTNGNASWVQRWWADPATPIPVQAPGVLRCLLRLAPYAHGPHLDSLVTVEDPDARPELLAELIVNPDVSVAQISAWGREVRHLRGHALHALACRAAQDAEQDPDVAVAAINEIGRYVDDGTGDAGGLVQRPRRRTVLSKDLLLDGVGEQRLLEAVACDAVAERIRADGGPLARYLLACSTGSRWQDALHVRPAKLALRDSHDPMAALAGLLEQVGPQRMRTLASLVEEYEGSLAELAEATALL